MSFGQGIMESIGNTILKIVLPFVIFAVVGSSFAGYYGYKMGKKTGYENGAKDALAGKVKWQQTVSLDSVLINVKK